MTKEINLTLRYLLPKKTLSVFFVAVFIGEMINLVDAYLSNRLITIKQLLEQISGFFTIMFIPEIVSFLGILFTLRWAHRLLKIKKVRMTANSIAVYELKLMVIILLSYFLYFPFTYIVRFILMGKIEIVLKTFHTLPFYDFHYFTLYAFPILFVGLIVANMSMVYDIVDSNKITNEVAEKVPEEISDKINTEETKIQEKENKENLIPIKILKVKDEKGKRDLKSIDIIYIQYSEIEKSRQVIFHHVNGTAKMRMSLAEIESEIISLGNFYRVSRSIIVNMNCIEEYLIDTNTKKMTIKLAGTSFIPDVSRYRILGFRATYADFLSSKQMPI
jgi:LytTr DNA-binding domain